MDDGLARIVLYLNIAMRTIHRPKFNHTIQLISSLILFLTTGGQSQFSSQYHKYPDTLILETHLERGMGLFAGGAGPANFKDTSEIKTWEHFPETGFVYPMFLDGLKVNVLAVYFTALEFYDRSTHQIRKPSFRGKYDNFILLIKGDLNGEEVFIVDQNHNQDLTDDPIRKLSNFNWYNTQGLIRCDYEAVVNGKSIQKHGYLNIGVLHGSILMSAFQHAETDFSIDGRLFKVGVMDGNFNSIFFLRPKLALLGTDGVIKDTLTKSEIVSLGEYIFLGDQPYRFDRFYNGSGTLILVKEHEYNTRIGTQLGLLAPDFRVKTVAGDMVAKSDLKDKPLMIVNLTGCNGPGTFKQFDLFYEKFHEDYHIISLEPLINKDLPGILVDTEVEENHDFYKKYRDAYSSYDVFQVGLDGRIEDLFDIHDWEKSKTR